MLISAAKHHVRKEILNPKCHGFRGPDLEQERKTERSLTALAATAPVNPSSESATARRAHAPGPDSVASGGGGGGGAVGWVCTERRRRKRGEVEAEVAAESRRAANILVCGRGKKRISPYWATEFWVGETLINPKFASLTSNDIKFASLTSSLLRSLFSYLLSPPLWEPVHGYDPASLGPTGQWIRQR